MIDKIIIKNQKDLNEHFKNHELNNAAFSIHKNIIVCHSIGSISKSGMHVYGCPICMKYFDVQTISSRRERIYRMLYGIDMFETNIEELKQFIKDEFHNSNTNYEIIARYYVMIALLKQEE